MGHYEQFYSKTFCCMMQQVSKSTAKKFFEEGKTIYLLPSKMRFDNIWQAPCSVSINRTLPSIGFDFGGYVERYKHYNCDGQRGKDVHYFIQVV